MAKLTERKIQLIHGMLIGRVPRKEIAEAAGISQPTLSRIAAVLGFAAYKHATPETKKAVLDYIVANPEEPYAQVAKKFGTNISAVKKVAADNGIRRYSSALLSYVAARGGK